MRMFCDLKELQPNFMKLEIKWTISPFFIDKKDCHHREGREIEN